MKKQFVNRLFISCFTIALSGLCFTACGSGSPAAGGQGGAAATEAVAEDAENGADIAANGEDAVGNGAEDAADEADTSENGIDDAADGEDAAGDGSDTSADALEHFAPVMDELRGVMENGADDEKEYHYVSSGIIEMSHWMDKDELQASIGYILTDINGDDAPELLIATIPDPQSEVEEKSVVLSGFTYRDGKLHTFLEGWARSSYQWLGGNRFYYFGSGGAMYSAFGVEILKKDGAELSTEDFYFTDERNGEQIFCHNQTGEWEVEKAEQMNVEADAFWKISEDYEKQIKQLSLTPLSEIGGV